MDIGNLKQKAHPILSTFVIACMIVTVGLLYIMQKSTATADNLNAKEGPDWQTYLN
jgi:hypothetical protein